MFSITKSQPQSASPSRAQKTIWAVVAILVAFILGPGFVDSLKPKPSEGRDFFQEWSSARNWREGQPIYMELQDAAERYLGRPRVAGERLMFARNAHPPPAVLLALPFAWLTYPNGMLAWNVLSLAALAFAITVIARDEHLVLRPWMVFPAIVAALLCSPFRQQVLQGQLNLYLLAMLTAAWAAERGGRVVLAGSLVGIAAAVKLFPGFVILYYLITRRFASAIAAIAGAGLTTMLALVVLGPQAFRDYVHEVMPMVGTFTNIWANASLAGFWTKWFNAGVTNTVIPPGPQHIPPIAFLPALASAGLVISAIATLAIWAHKVRRLPLNLRFGITLVAMLLLSPITWDHYFLLLALPMVHVWRVFPDDSLQRIGLILVVIAMMLSPVMFVQAFAGGGTLLALLGASIHLFALVGLFLLMLLLPTATEARA